jgi:hypothetical protein
MLKKTTILDVPEPRFGKRYTPLETSKIIRKSPAWLQADRCGEGLIPFVKAGHRVFYLENDLRVYLESLPRYRTTSEFLKKKKEGGEYVAK